MKSPLRIAILACDTPQPKADAKYGGYGGLFEQFLRSGVEALGEGSSDVNLKLSKYHVQLEPDKYPEPDDIDAILITGSRMHLAR